MGEKSRVLLVLLVLLCGLVFGWIVQSVTGLVNAVDKVGRDKGNVEFAIDRR